MSQRNTKLEQMVEAIAEQDCETPEDVAMGLCYAIQEHIRFPILGKMIGEDVTILGVDEGEGVDLMATCERKGKRYRVRLADVELTARPAGVEWIDAYRLFRRSNK